MGHGRRRGRAGGWVIDETVLVTGATSGIGAGIAARFHARGARVFIADRDHDRLETVAARLPGMLVVVMDVADAVSIEQGMTEVARAAPHLTTLVNNAGIQRQLDFSGPEPPSPTVYTAEIRS